MRLKQKKKKNTNAIRNGPRCTMKKKKCIRIYAVSVHITIGFEEVYILLGCSGKHSAARRRRSICYSVGCAATNVCKAVFKADDYYEALAGSTTKHQHFAAAPFSFKY